MEINANQLLIRIRPQKIAIVVNEDINTNQLISLLAFLSRIWGGRYSSIMVVSKKENGVSAKRGLSSIRPELVFGVGVDAKEWVTLTRKLCQPRAFAILDLNESSLKEFMRDNFFGIIWADYIVRAEVTEFPEMERKNLRLFKTEVDSPLATLVAASFGLVPDNKVQEYAEALKAEFHKITAESDIYLYLRICTEMAKRWSWLDYANNRLKRILTNPNIPTVVIINEDNPIFDVALFWNLRMQFGLGSSGNIVLFPQRQIENLSSVEALINWIDTSPISSNYIELVSRSCSNSSLETLARRIRPRLRKLKSRIEHVDVQGFVNDMPHVIPFEREIEIRPFISGNLVSIEGVQPVYEESLSSSAAWIADLVKDTYTGRLPYEICLPPRESASQVLNAPNPPSVRFGIVDVLGYGVDSINVRFTKQNQSISFRVPSAEELLEEITIEAGIKLIKDEKRIRYTQTIDMLGDLFDSARFFSGISLKILEAFESKPLTFDQIKEKAKLGKGQTTKKPLFLEWANRLPEYSRRVTEKRYLEYLRVNLSLHASEIEIIEKLIERGVLRRKWRLDKCPYCDKDYWVDNLEIHGPMICPGCYKRIALRDKVQLGYELNELVALAIREGIIPVVLTARFLHNLTNMGFFWLPGLKCSRDSVQADFDILACCDGHLIAAECKTLTGTASRSRMWKEIADQVSRAIELGKICGIKALIIAAMCTEFPKHFKDKLRKLTDENMSLLFLNKADLEEGYRRIPFRGQQTRLMRVSDILPHMESPSKKRRRKKGKRFVSF